MLYVTFQLGDDRYALAASEIAGILPLVRIKQLHGAPRGVAGAINHRGAPVPVIDLGELALGRPVRRRLSTRTILVHYPDPGGSSRLLGLLAERATGTVRRDAADFVPAGVASDGAPYLGPVASDGGTLLQRVDVARLLSDEVRAALFPHERS